MKIIPIAILVSIMLSFVTGCSMKEEYHVILKNVGPSGVDAAYVKYGSFQSAGGLISGNLEYKSMFVNKEEPIPEKATVEWVSVKNGERYLKEVDVGKQLPRPFKGELIFTFKNDNVTVSWDVRDVAEDSKGVWR